jgi:hypothetical protein
MDGRWRSKQEVINAVQKSVRSRDIWKSYQIVLFVLPRKAELIYSVIKQATNKELCIPTQCVVSNNLQQKNGPIIMGLWFQIQSKVFL